MHIGADRRHGRGLGTPLARLAWLAAAALAVGGLIGWARLDFGALPVSEGSGIGVVLGCLILSLTYASVGFLLADRRPANAIAWLFLCAAVGLGTVLPANVLVAAAHAVLRPVPLPTLALAWWVSTMTLPIYAVLGTWTVLTFPDGRPISRPWWGVLAGSVFGAGLLVASAGVDPSGLMWYPSLVNPFAVQGLDQLLTGARALGAGIELAAMLGAAASLVLRFHRADPALRAQLRWVGAAAAVAGLAAGPAMFARYVPFTSATTGEILMLVAVAGQSAIPIGAGIAILRHHLYDIELVVDRSLVYLPLMGLLGGLYAGSVTLGQRVFVALTGDTSDVAIIFSSLLVAWVFTPLRRQLEACVDRRVRAAKGPQDERTLAERDIIDALEEEMKVLEHRTGRLEVALAARHIRRARPHGATEQQTNRIAHGERVRQAARSTIAAGVAARFDGTARPARGSYAGRPQQPAWSGNR